MAKMDIPMRDADPIDEREKYPSNSDMRKAQRGKVVEKVIEGKAVKRKKGLGRKLSETIIGDSADNVREYIIWDVLVPALKETISDAVSGGIQMLLFGDKRPASRSISRDRGTSYVSYSSYYDRDKPVRPRETRPLDDRRGRSRVVDVDRAYSDEIVLESRGEAESVLDSLLDIIDRYEVASVADLYELVGIASQFTDNKYGWENLSAARVVRVRGGYMLDLPKPHAID